MSLGQMRSRIWILLCLNWDVGSSTWLAQGLGEAERVFPCSVGHLAQQMVPELQDGESGLVLLVGREEAGDNGRAWDPHTCSCSSRVTRDYEIQELSFLKGFPGGASGKEYTRRRRRCQRCRFNPWVGKISWRRKWQPAPVFLPGESHGQRSLVGYSRGVAKSWTRLCMHPHKLLRTVSPLSPIFSPSGRDTHALSLTHTPSQSYSWSQSRTLYCASQYAHPLFHTLSHTTSAVCFAGVLVQERRGTSVLLVPVKWCVEPREARLSRPHEDAAEPAPVLSWPNTACSLETGKCRNWRSLWMAWRQDWNELHQNWLRGRSRVICWIQLWENTRQVLKARKQLYFFFLWWFPITFYLHHSFYIYSLLLYVCMFKSWLCHSKYNWIIFFVQLKLKQYCIFLFFSTPTPVVLG